jgi:hypothetical protein
VQQKSITRSLGTERLSVGLVELPAKKECSAATTCAPSPTAAATGFTGFARPPVDRKNWLPRYVPTPTRTSDTRIFVPTYNARDNIECCSMGRFTSSRIARIFNIVLLDCATLAVGGAGLTIVGLAALRCFWNIDLTYNNEGWNAYHQAAALRGDNVYPPAGALIFNHYPPLSFIVIGALARLGGDVVVIGRLISVASLIVIAISGLHPVPKTPS